jgi:hypothetical protein
MYAQAKCRTELHWIQKSSTTIKQLLHVSMFVTFSVPLELAVGLCHSHFPVPYEQTAKNEDKEEWRSCSCA